MAKRSAKSQPMLACFDELFEQMPTAAPIDLSISPTEEAYSGNEPQAGIDAPLISKPENGRQKDMHSF